MARLKEHQKPIASIEDTVVEPETTETPETISIEYDHDPETNTVSFSLSNGTEITVREPKAIDFLRVKGWRDAAPPDDQSAQMLAYKMVSLCAVSFKRPDDRKPQKSVSVYDLVDCFETQQDMLMAANCLDFFRDSIGRLTGIGSDLQLQQSPLHSENVG